MHSYFVLVVAAPENEDDDDYELDTADGKPAFGANASSRRQERAPC